MPSASTLVPASSSGPVAVWAEDYAEDEAATPANRARWLSQVLAALRDRSLPADDTLQPLGLLGYAAALAWRASQPPSAEAQAARLVALAANLPLRAALGQAAGALAAAGIQAIVYKGQDYLDRVYGDLGARPMADADLLVREHELAAAEAALLEAGFRRDTHCQQLHERKFVKHGMAIDLHHGLLASPRMRVAHEELFARAIPSPSTPGLWVLEATDAFLVHCVAQTVKGLALPASSYVELQSLHAGANPRLALERARRWRACSALYASLLLLAKLGHREAKRLAQRVPLAAAGRRRVEGLLGCVALRTRFWLPRRALLLAVKLALVDDARDACRSALRFALFRARTARRAVPS